MKKETNAILVLTVIIWGAIFSHLTHTEPVVEVKESFKFVKVKDWSEGATGYKLRYFEHLYRTK